MTPERIDALTREQLAAECDANGVYEGFFDIWGAYHEASDDLKRSLLKTLLESQEPDLELPRVDDTETTLGLYDVCRVVRSGEPLEVNVSVRLSETSAVHWLLQLEDGVQVHGRFDKPSEQTSEWHPSGVGAKLNPRGEPWRPAETADWRQHLCLQIETLDTAGEPGPLPLGYHELVLTVITSTDRAEAATVCCPIAITPARCFAFSDKAGGGATQDGRYWGLSAQLYSIRSERNWGIGDFSDLRALIRLAGELGANAVGLNPLHAVQTLRPGLGSPYSPTSREFLNPLYLDLESIPDFGQSECARQMTRTAAFAAALAQARNAELVDYDLIAKLKMPVLRAMFEHFKANCLDNSNTEENAKRAADFRVFERTHGNSLQYHCLFEALQAHIAKASFQAIEQYDTNALSGWPTWPEKYRDPQSEAVVEFARTNRAEMEFFQYLQWCTQAQLSECAKLAEDIGLECGLYLDLALGNDGGGAEVWASQADYAIGASLGAPPDDLSPGGQDWGIIALNPARLPANAYQPFVRVLAAQMRAASVLRIDHVMGLMRQFWTVSTAAGMQGGYVSAPFDELLALVALESVRNQCVVIGEDLGTVPIEVRDRLHAYGVLSYRVLYFEKHWDEDGRFNAPDEYPAQALAVASTHDLPTVIGFWRGTDVAARIRIGVGSGGFPNEEVQSRVCSERASDRARLLTALEPFGLERTDDSCTAPPLGLVESVHRFLSQTPCQLAMVQLEDLLAVEAQANLPGTTVEHCNWCRKLPVPIEQWRTDEAFLRTADVMQARRGNN